MEKNFNEVMLRTVMSASGDYDIVSLAEPLNLTPQQIYKRFWGLIEWKVADIRVIANRYNLSDSEIVEIFKLRGEKDDSQGSSKKDGQE